jgi:hypothetical protein
MSRHCLAVDPEGEKDLRGREDLLLGFVSLALAQQGHGEVEAPDETPGTLAGLWVVAPSPGEAGGLAGEDARR